MDRKLIISELKNNLQKVSQVIALIENYDNSNASVELDLMQKNITILFENYVKLKISYEQNISKPAQEVIPTPPVVHTKHVEEPAPTPPVIKPAPIVEPKTEPKEEAPKTGFGFSFNLGDDEGKINRSIESKPEEKTNPQSDFNLEKAINEALNIALNQRPVAPAEKTEVPAEKVDTSANTADKDLTLNERFSTLKKDVNLAERHLNNPITDLSKEISLNKKFAFVNELFDGNMDQYSAAIQQLNNIGSLEYAKKYINELKATRRWDRESATVNSFIELVERRWER